jgi:hypothetical protein
VCFGFKIYKWVDILFSLRNSRIFLARVFHWEGFFAIWNTKKMGPWFGSQRFTWKLTQIIYW